MSLKKDRPQPVSQETNPTQADLMVSTLQRLHLPRRTFLQLLTAAAIINQLPEPAAASPAQDTLTPSQHPDTQHSLLLPQLEKSLTPEQQLAETFAKYFPEMYPLAFILGTKTEAEQPGVTKSVQAWQFWADEFYPMYAKSKQLLEQSGIANNYFPESVELFILNMVTEQPQAFTTLRPDDNGVITYVELTMYYAYAEAIVGEFIHLLQNRPSLANGITIPTIEGISNVLHFNGMVWWHAINQEALDNNQPEQAVVMPMLSTSNEVHTNLTIPQFNQHIVENLVQLQEIFNRSHHYLYTYTSKEELGVSEQYPAALQLLGNYAGDYFRYEYHQTIEQLAGLVSNTILGEVFTPEDTFLLSPLLVQGNDYNLDHYPESVKAAVTKLRHHHLLLVNNDWQELLAQYSQRNAGELALRPIVSAHATETGSIDHVALTIYLSMINPDLPTPTYKELRKQDVPKASLHFLAPDAQGNEIWWEYPLEIEPSQDIDTMIYFVRPPKTIRLDGFPPRWISTEGRSLVIKVIIDSAEEVPMQYEANFQINNAQFDAVAAETRKVTDVLPDDEIVAKPSIDPAESSFQVAVTQTELSPEAQAHIDALSARVKEVNRSEVSFGRQTEVTLTEGEDMVVASPTQSSQSEDSEQQVEVVFEKVGRLEDEETLKQRLNKVLQRYKK